MVAHSLQRKLYVLKALWLWGPGEEVWALPRSDSSSPDLNHTKNAERLTHTHAHTHIFICTNRLNTDPSGTTGLANVGKIPQATGFTLFRLLQVATVKNKCTEGGEGVIKVEWGFMRVTAHIQKNVWRTKEKISSVKFKPCNQSGRGLVFIRYRSGKVRSIKDALWNKLPDDTCPNVCVCKCFCLIVYYIFRLCLFWVEQTGMHAMWKCKTSEIQVTLLNGTIVHRVSLSFCQSRECGA